MVHVKCPRAFALAHLPPRNPNSAFISSVNFTTVPPHLLPNAPLCHSENAVSSSSSLQLVGLGTPRAQELALGCLQNLTTGDGDDGQRLKVDAFQAGVLACVRDFLDVGCGVDEPSLVPALGLLHNINPLPTHRLPAQQLNLSIHLQQANCKEKERRVQANKSKRPWGTTRSCSSLCVSTRLRPPTSHRRLPRTATSTEGVEVALGAAAEAPMEEAKAPMEQRKRKQAYEWDPPSLLQRQCTVEGGSPFYTFSLVRWILHLLYAPPVGDRSTMLQCQGPCKMHLHATLKSA
jgi:hypothetical protein